MAALDDTVATLADMMKLMDPDGGIGDVAFLLSQTNRILDDAIWKASNGPTTHQETVNVGLPDVYWRAYNQGIPSSKSKQAQTVEPMAMLEAYSKVDMDLAMINGNTARWRMNESRAFLESMNQEQAEAMFYANPAVDTKQFLGLAPRYSALGAGNGQNILNAGGAGADNTSIWLVVWGEPTVFGVFPKGSQAGLLREDLGQQTAWDFGGAGLHVQVLMERFQWKSGLCVKDWRYVVRICNIDASDAVSATGSQETTDITNIIFLMTRALDRIPTMEMGTPVFYCNRTIRSALAIQGIKHQSNVLSVEQGARSLTVNFLGVPVKLCDQILNTESLVA